MLAEMLLRALLGTPHSEPLSFSGLCCSSDRERDPHCISASIIAVLASLFGAVAAPAFTVFWMFFFAILALFVTWYKATVMFFPVLDRASTAIGLEELDMAVTAQLERSRGAMGLGLGDYIRYFLWEWPVFIIAFCLAPVLLALYTAIFVAVTPFLGLRTGLGAFRDTSSAFGESSKQLGKLLRDIDSGMMDYVFGTTASILIPVGCIECCEDDEDDDVAAYRETRRVEALRQAGLNEDYEIETKASDRAVHDGPIEAPMAPGLPPVVLPTHVLPPHMRTRRSGRWLHAQKEADMQEARKAALAAAATAQDVVSRGAVAQGEVEDEVEGEGAPAPRL